MNIVTAETSSAPEIIGKQMYGLIVDLYPFCRSLTGEGVRKTLSVLQQHISLDIREVPTGTPVFDWTIPKEWNIRDAYVKNAQGDRVIDFHRSNLHLVSYSIPVRQKVGLQELREHLFTIPDHPEWIPYRTAYYKENWGFCVSYQQYAQLTEQEYEVYIDASLEDGSLSYGEYYLPGDTRDEVLLSCHICHPSLCNDNLSGIALVTFLAKYLRSLARRYSYRFLFIPGTIGSITWLALNEAQVSLLKHGMVIAGIGDAGNFSYKKSRRGDTEIDKAVEHVLQHSGCEYAIREFSPYGYDERQFCSPGFNLPVGCLMRTPHGEYPEYHTSADNIDFVHPSSLAGSYMQCLSVLDVLENNLTYVNLNPKCEPQLGRRGLYRAIGGQAANQLNELAMLWVLNLSDGQHSLLDIAIRSGQSFRSIKLAAEALLGHHLLAEIS